MNWTRVNINIILLLLSTRNRDIVDEENPYDTVTIEDDYKIYEDICSMNIPQKVGAIFRDGSDRQEVPL